MLIEIEIPEDNSLALTELARCFENRGTSRIKDTIASVLRQADILDGTEADAQNCWWWQVQYCKAERDTGDLLAKVSYDNGPTKKER